MIKIFLNRFNSLEGNTKELLSKSSQAFTLQVIGKFAAYLFTVVITRNLGASVWGSFTIAYALLRMIGMVGSLGINTSIIRFLSEYRIKNDRYKIKSVISKIILLQSVIGVILAGSIYIFSSFIAGTIFNNPSLASGIRIISFAVPLFILIQSMAGALRGMSLIKEQAFVRETAIFLFAAIASFTYLTISRKEISPLFPHYLYAISTAITLIIALIIWFNKTKISITNFTEKNTNIKYILKASLPMLLSSSMLFLMAWIDTLMLGVMDSESNVGIYNITIKVSQIMFIPFTAISALAAPKIGEYYVKKDFLALKKFVRSVTNMTFFTGLPIFLLIMIFPNFILSFFGEGFSNGKFALYVLSIGVLFSISAGTVAIFLNMTNKQLIFQRIVVFATLINIVLNLVLIPRYSILGAAIANSFSLFLWNFISIYYIWRHYKINTFIIDFHPL